MGNLRWRRGKDRFFHMLFILATSLAMLVLMVLLTQIIMDGLPRLSGDFITSFPSNDPVDAGIKSAIIGTLYVIGIMIPIAFMLGVGAAIYLEEFAQKNRATNFIQLNIRTLAGVPSIVYGILGLTLFVRGMSLGQSILSGALTMTLLVLPIIIVAAQEAIRAVPRSRREAAFALGATKWQMVSRAVIPSAFPGILTGMILAVSRAVGETAPLLMVGAFTFVAFLPESPLDSFTVLPIQFYNWISRPQEEYHMLAASGIIVLLVILIMLNISAVWLRNKYQKRI